MIRQASDLIAQHGVSNLRNLEALVELVEEAQRDALDSVAGELDEDLWSEAAAIARSMKP
jgi:hypothetical protein